MTGKATAEKRDRDGKGVEGRVTESREREREREGERENEGRSREPRNQRCLYRGLSERIAADSNSERIRAGHRAAEARVSEKGIEQLFEPCPGVGGLWGRERSSLFQLTRTILLFRRGESVSDDFAVNAIANFASRLASEPSGSERSSLRLTRLSELESE